MKMPSFTSLLIGSQFTGIEHFSLKNQEMTALIGLRKKKGELLIEETDTRLFSEGLPEKWEKSGPFFLAINTSQVIQKEIGSTDPSDEKLLHKAFPNLERDAFYYEIWRLKSRSVVSISRMAYVNDLVSAYQKQNIAVAGVSLGISAVSELQQYSGEGSLLTNTAFIAFDSDPIITPNTENLTATLTINGLAIQSNYINPFGGILRLLPGHTANGGNLDAYNLALRDSYLQQRFFSKGFKIILISLLAVLLLNFFAFNHYFKKEQEISEHLAVSKSSVETITKAKERVAVKEEKVKNAVAMSSSKSSLLLNEIAKAVPKAILLSALAYTPLEKKVKENEALAFQEKTILISGKTIENSSFTHWVETLGKLRWTDKVVITHFGKNEANETVFTIRLTLK